MVDLIYCASGNARFAQIAIDAGFLYGAQLPATIYHAPYFVDQNWKTPDFARYILSLAEYRPAVATVLDWERQEQLPEVLKWAEWTAVYVDEVIIIPKVQGSISQLPRTIGGKPVRLGYSVPTRFGGTELPLWEFSEWPVHLLGGNPGQQMKLAQYLNVVSADGNMMQKLATQNCAFWRPGKKPFTNSWPSLRQANGGEKWGDGSDAADAPYEAFYRSCENIKEAWRLL